MTQILRALHVVVPTREGGLERVVTMMSAGQKEKRVHVAAVLERGDIARHPFVDRLNALDIPVTAIVVGARSYLDEYRQLKTLIRRLRPQIVHTHGYRADVIGGAAGRANNLPTVSTVHGFTGGGFRNRFYEIVQLQALRRMDAVIAVSAPLVRKLEQNGVAPGRIRLVTNGFTPPEVTVPRLAARARLGIGRDDLVAGWVGRLSREKGADVMLDALAVCDSSWSLSVIGDGGELEQLKRKAGDLGIENRVTWHGAVADAASLFAAFDAFVLSSRTEGTPITLFEAMHSRVPIIATRVGGVPDVVTSAQAILVDSEAPRAIASALAEVRRDTSAAVRRTELARERLLTSYSSTAWLSAVDAVYESALVSFHGRPS